MNLLVLLACVAGAATADWRGALMSFRDGAAFRSALETVVEDEGAHDADAAKLLSHLQQNDLRYGSLDQLARHWKRVVITNPSAPTVREDLRWLAAVLEDLEREFPENPTILAAVREVESAIASRATIAPGQALRALITPYLRNHILERAEIERIVGVPFDAPTFDEQALMRLQDGELERPLKRLLLGRYVKLASIFSPTAREAREASERFWHNGDRGMSLQTARRYRNPRNFVRNGWDPEHDILRIANGSMRERVYRVQDRAESPRRKVEAKRVILIFADTTSSMLGDGRGELRNLLLSSYVDQVFSEATSRGDRVAIHVVPYYTVAKAASSARTLGEAKELFGQVAEMESPHNTLADHATVIESTLRRVLAEDDRPTHVNVILATDGDEAVNVASLKGYLSTLPTGAEGLRFGFAALSFVTGAPSLERMTAEMNAARGRFLSSGATHQFFDAAFSRRWTEPGWSREFLPRIGEEVWQTSPVVIERIAAALRAIDFFPRASHGIVGEAEVTAPESTGELDDVAPEGETPEDPSQAPEGENVGAEAQEKLGEMPEPENHEQEGEASTVYRLTGGGALPSMLYVAQMNNVRGTERLRVRLNTGVRAVLQVESLIASAVNKGYAPLAKPAGYAISELRVFDEQRREIAGAEVYQLARNGLYIMRVPSGAKSIYYQAGFVSEGVLKRSSLFDRLNRDALRTVAAQLRIDRLAKPARALERLGWRRRYAEGVAKALRGAACYTDDGKTTGSAGAGGRFAKYQRFLRDDVLHYQCTGAAWLTRDVFEAYAEVAAQPRIRAEVVGGYAVSGPEVTSADGHAVTFLSDSALVNAPLVLDATPGRARGDWLETLRRRAGEAHARAEAALRRVAVRLGKPLRDRYDRAREKCGSWL